MIQIQGEYSQVKGGVNKSMVPYVVSSSTHRVVAGQKVRLASVSTDVKEQ